MVGKYTWNDQYYNIVIYIYINIYILNHNPDVFTVLAINFLVTNHALQLNSVASLSPVELVRSNGTIATWL